jgi:hypothetical protein
MYLRTNSTHCNGSECVKLYDAPNGINMTIKDYCSKGSEVDELRFI